jgi:pyruvate/2-oxoglutarate dehydrogenase complex dihydrolipoamide dehydrogenase (E3) component
MDVRTGVEARQVRSTGSGVSISTDHGEVEADQLLVASSRRPRTQGLELARAGVRLAGAAIEVDGHLRTSQPHIYAAGDVTGSFQFTHYAGWQGFKAARNALLPGASSGLRSSVPWAVFTDPEVAQAGDLTGEMHEWPLERHDRAQAAGLQRGLVRVYCDREGHVTGALVCLEAAGELINELSVAMEARLKLKDLASAIHVYPSFGFVIQQLAAQASVQESIGGVGGRLLKTFVR